MPISDQNMVLLVLAAKVYLFAAGKDPYCLVVVGPGSFVYLGYTFTASFLS
jgi:hypothetical protein